ncbi:hypothetical protein PUR71_17415 [Streptomyces sp. SP17BM10]|uniref:hypothetical protein n=1 Tax=Streptomyces sp. SP17BM10 TaxID=3002530 RepID=UPI002E76C151|nr:hypothetical protein [Streptomyces sp. SP17BM10]MEE1784670.1 hypothetical protein [Streptomyces sp. SP17BM10]
MTRPVIVAPEAPAAARTRWRRAAAERPAALRVALLASYTVDPLLPYLGVQLADAGLTPEFTLGSYNQIVQQCLDDQGAIARSVPDVLVVAPRLEEVPAADLPALAETALGAAERWGAGLVFVLPAIPEERPFGVGDGTDPRGVVASATAAREQVRRRLGASPVACVADAEEAVRAVGSRAAHRPALYRLAKIPYSEEVFAELGRQVGGLLRARLGATWRAVVVETDGMASDWVAEQLPALRRAGLRVAVRERAELARTGADVELEDELGVALERSVRLVVASQTPESESESAPGGLQRAAAAVGVGPDEPWIWALHRAGVLDRMPVSMPDADADHGLTPSAASDTDPRSVTLADFVTGLRTEVDCVPVTESEVPKFVDVVERAKDFTMGARLSRAELVDFAGSTLGIRVRDRLGDYGVSGAVGYQVSGREMRVSVFSLSCPVLGKGTEDLVLAELADLADRSGCTDLVLTARRTEHNAVAVDFLAGIDAREWHPRTRVRAVVEAGG